MKRNFVVLTPKGSVETYGTNALNALKRARVPCRRRRISGIIDARCVVEPKQRTQAGYASFVGYKFAEKGQSL